MKKELIRKLEWIHNVVCPVCSSKASFTITGPSAWESNLCCHEELEKLVRQREKEINRPGFLPGAYQSPN
jgi:hypothetical protein